MAQTAHLTGEQETMETGICGNFVMEENIMEALGILFWFWLEYYSLISFFSTVNLLCLSAHWISVDVSWHWDTVRTQLSAMIMIINNIYMNDECDCSEMEAEERSSLSSTSKETE